MANLVSVCPKPSKTRALSLKERITNRDYMMHKLWTNGNMPIKKIAKRFETSEKTVKRRIKLVEDDIGTVKAKEDILSALIGIGPDAWAGLHTHVRNGNLEAILNVLKHLGMGQGGSSGDYLEVTDEESWIEEQTELRSLIEEQNSAANGGGATPGVPVATKRTRKRTKTIRRSAKREA